MLFGARAGLQPLALFCRQMALSLEAGLDLRRILAPERIQKAPLTLRRTLGILSGEVSLGQTLTDALARTGGYFPPLFREMLAVGEESGKLAEVFRELADHYERQLRLRRAFLASLTWPATQLTAAILVVGLVIWIMGWIAVQPGQPTIDMLGLGLVGTRGLVIYFLFIALAAAAVAFIVRAFQRGMMWTAPIQRLVLAVPVLGTSLRTLGLARLAWTMHLTLETGMDLRRALPLCLRSTQQVLDRRVIDEVVMAVMSGYEISEAMAATGVYPPEFLESLEVGERSGRLPEAMAVLSRQYQERSQQALATLTTLAGFGVWAAVAALIVVLIFRIFFFYLNSINQALGGL